MNDINISDLIKIEDVSQYKLHVARYNGEYQPLDVFVKDKKEWFRWNTYRGTKDEFSRNYIFSIIDFYPENNVWLFGGIFKIITKNNLNNSHSYEIEEVTKFSNFVGRLKIYLPKPSRGRAFYLENYFNNMIVSEILKEVYSGEVFPGYENINHNFFEMKQIFDNEKLDWKSSLESIKGVYLIVDKKNGKKYVGSAYGEYGIWSRWKCYMETGHGWNDELTTLIREKGLVYAMENFKLTLLEYFSMKKEDKYIINRENFWKEALITRSEFGYNKN